MRRTFMIAAFVVLVLVAFVSASAQRGGMRASGGGRGGAVGRAIGRTSGGGHGVAIRRSIGGTSGGHAFGGDIMNPPVPLVGDWSHRLEAWMRYQKLLDPKKVP